MNWIKYSKQKPEPEPKRQVLIEFTPEFAVNRKYSTAWSYAAHPWIGVSHWCEIEGPEWTDEAKEAKKIIDREIAKNRARLN